MKRSILRVVLLVLAALLATVPSAVAGEATGKMIISTESVDLPGRKLNFKLTTKARSAKVTVFTPDGKQLHEKTYDFGEAAPRKPLSVGWPDLGEHKDNFRLELEVDDTEDNVFTYQLIRFYFEIPHEEVVFPSGEWGIEAAEEEKLVEPLRLLQEAIAKYKQYIDLQLYVAGYTDTVGPNHKNQVLSEKRAHSIAEWFTGHGLEDVPVFVRGFGEGRLAVKTGDNVDEPRNRRAQYIVSTSPPAMAGPGAWKRIK